MKRSRSSMMIVVLTLCAFGLVRGATLRVPDDYAEIQAAIDTSADGDTVLVAPGQYVITEPITFRGKAITVKSEDGPDETIIQMGAPADPERASVAVFTSNETSDSVLDGFTITGGRGSLDASRNEWVGGGIVFDASSGTVRNCAIMKNTAMHGGGVLCVNPCSPNLIDCTIADNSAELGFGGGVFAFGGSSVSVANCIIRDNAATGHMYGTGCGGGVCCFLGSSLTMTDCTVAGNAAGNTGAGVLNGENSSATLIRS